MANVHYPVAIVGAGPAGSACANAFLLGGVTGIALIDKARFPRDKACGDGLGAGVIAILDALGLQESLNGHARVTQLSVTSSLGRHAILDTGMLHRRSPLGYVIPRLDFDDALLKAALRRGAADVTGWCLETATFADQRWHLTLAHSDTDETRSITADVLVGADGATSKVRRLLGQPFNSDRHASVAVRIYAKTERTPAYQQVDFVKGWPSPSYGWVFTTGKDVVNVGVAVDLVAYKSQTVHLNTLLKSYKSHLADRFSYDEQSCRSCPLPFAIEMPRLGLPETRAALIGDAASMINPLTGEGIFYGMAAGLQLGRELAAAKKRSADFATALSRYERKFRRVFVPHFRGNWYLRRFLTQPAMLERAAARWSRNRDLFCDYIEYMMGQEGGIGTKPLYRIVLETVFA